MANTSSWENHTYKLVNFVCCFAHQICQGKLMVVRLDRINTILMTFYAHSGCSCLVIFARAKSSQSETLGRYVITIEFSGLVLRVLYFLCCSDGYNGLYFFYSF